MPFKVLYDSYQSVNKSNKVTSDSKQFLGLFHWILRRLIFVIKRRPSNVPLEFYGNLVHTMLLCDADNAVTLTPSVSIGDVCFI